MAPKDLGFLHYMGKAQNIHILHIYSPGHADSKYVWHLGVLDVVGPGQHDHGLQLPHLDPQLDPHGELHWVRIQNFTLWHITRNILLVSLIYDT